MHLRILSFKFTRQFYFYVLRICKETLLNRIPKPVWRYSEDVITNFHWKRAQILRGEKNRFGNQNINYWACDIARDAMPEPAMTDLDSDDDNSLTGTAS